MGACSPSPTSAARSSSRSRSAALTLVATAYAFRALTLSREGRPVPTWRLICFASGLGLIAIAFLSPLGHLDAELVLAHMGQHLLMGDLGALLIVLGLTGPLLQPLLAQPLARLDAPPRPSAGRPADLGRRPLRLAPAVPLPGGNRAQRGPRPPAHLLHRLRRADVDAAGRAAAAAEVVRDPGEDRLPDRRALHRHRPRERPDVVELGLLSGLRRRRGEVAHLGGDRPEHRRRDHDGGGRVRHVRACSPGSSSCGRSRTPSASASSISPSRVAYPSARPGPRARPPPARVRAWRSGSRPRDRADAAPGPPSSRRCQGRASESPRSIEKETSRPGAPV